MNWFFGTATPDAAATNGEKNDVPTTDSTENTNKRATTGSSRGQTWSSWWRGGAKEGNTQADTSKPDVHRRKVSLASKHAKTIFGAMATGVEESTRMEKRTGVVLGLSVIVMAIVSAALVFPWWPLYIVFSIHLCIFGSIMIVIELPDVKWSRKHMFSLCADTKVGISKRRFSEMEESTWGILRCFGRDCRLYLPVRAVASNSSYCHRLTTFYFRRPRNAWCSEIRKSGAKDEKNDVISYRLLCVLGSFTAVF